METLLIEEHSEKVAKIARTSGHFTRLQAVLGNGAEWHYRGECIELEHANGECACGHVLKYLFPIYHADGRRVVVGSTCIENYPSVSPELVADVQTALKGAMEAHRETLRKAKRAAEEAEVIALAEKASNARRALYQAVAALPLNSFLPCAAYRHTYGVYSARLALQQGSQFPIKLPPLKTPKGQMGRLQGLIQSFEAARAELAIAATCGQYR